MIRKGEAKDGGLNKKVFNRAVVISIVLAIVGTGFSYEAYAGYGSGNESRSGKGKVAMSEDEGIIECQTEYVMIDDVGEPYVLDTAADIGIETVLNKEIETEIKAEIETEAGTAEALDGEDDKSEEALIIDKEVEMTDLLGINIYTSGEIVCLKNNNYNIYTQSPVLFNCIRPGGFETDNLIREEYYYAVRKGADSAYGKYETADNGRAIICPPGNEGECYVNLYSRVTIRVDREDTPADSALDEANSDEFIYAYICRSAEYHIVFDFTPPEAAERTSIDWDKWTSEIRSAEFEVTDIRSGVSRIVASCNGNVIYEYHGYSENTDNAEGTDDISEKVVFSIPLDIDSTDSSGTNVHIMMCDKAGNESSAEYTYYLDRTKPTLNVAGLINNMIYNCETAPVLNAEDDIEGSVSVDYEIVRTIRGIRNSLIRRSVSCNDNSSKVTSATERLYLDGEYELVAKARDLAGNESEQVIYRFRIDRTEPSINIGGFTSGDKLSRSVSASVNLSDDFYSDTSATISVIRRWPDGEKIYLNERFTLSDYEYIRNIQLDEDGDYIITVNAEDAAGNIASKEAYLRIDRTSPEMALTGISANQITAQHPAITLNVKEMFYSGTNVSLALVRINKGSSYEGILETAFRPEKADYNYQFDVPGEGDFILKVIAADETGNRSESDIRFVVDCSAPSIGWIDGLKKKYLKSFIFPEKFISNISDATAVKYTAFLNAYRIDEGDSVANDGKYVLRIIAVDEAGNTSEEEAEFIVDSASPRIVVSGLGSDGSVRKGEGVTFTLFDKGDIFEYVKFDGENIELTDKSVCSIDINDNAEHVIDLKAVDLAGNETVKTFHIAGKVYRKANSLTGRSGVINRSDKEGDSVNITKNSDEKYVYIFYALFCGICVVGVPILLGLRHVDTNE